MNTAIHHGLYGLYGLGQQSCGAGAAAIHSAVGTGLATGAALDPEPISKAILGVAALVQNFFGHPDCNKIATTEIVNQAELFLRQNLTAWQSLSADQKTLKNQQAALQVFDGIWTEVLNACAGTQQYGSAGIACIADRQAGACHYKDASGACWNWFIGYRDPIANDPQVRINSAAAPVSSAVSSALSPLTSSISSLLPGVDPTMILIGGGILLLVLIL